MHVSFQTLVDECAGCGFDSRIGTLFDAIRTIGLANVLVDLACESMAPDLFQVRPSDGSATVDEHIETLVDLIGEARQIFAPAIEVLDGDGNRDFDVTIRLKHEAALASATLGVLTPEQIETVVPEGHSASGTIGTVIRQLAHAVLHQQAEIARTRHLLGDGVDIGSGLVIQVSGSKGGLPKTPLLLAQVDNTGVEGDRQATRRHHGAPVQALCLFSAEVIDEFAAQGHPVTYGATGENLTIRGLDWSKLRAGLELEIGGVTCRLTAPAVPCSQNSPWFTDGDFSRLSHTKHPGHSRWYASVVRGGTIQASDQVQQTWS